MPSQIIGAFQEVRVSTLSLTLRGRICVNLSQGELVQQINLRCLLGCIHTEHDNNFSDLGILRLYRKKTQLGGVSCVKACRVTILRVFCEKSLDKY